MALFCPLLPYLLERLLPQASSAAASWYTGMLCGAYMFAVFLFAPLWGFLSDRIKRSRKSTKAMCQKMHIDRSSNRMALSLVTLGIWIAASLLMQLTVGPRIGDRPLLALLGYGCGLRRAS
jgi:MFS family permease